MAQAKAKLRHIAISVSDVAAAQKFFEEAFGMVKSGDASSGVHMTDGVINVALLKFREKITVAGSDEPYYGPAHFGIWVDDFAQAEQQVTAAGAVLMQKKPPTREARPDHEIKFCGPDGLIFDLSQRGWPGAVKNVKPD